MMRWHVFLTSGSLVKILQCYCSVLITIVTIKIVVQLIKDIMWKAMKVWVSPCLMTTPQKWIVYPSLTALNCMLDFKAEKQKGNFLMIFAVYMFKFCVLCFWWIVTSFLSHAIANVTIENWRLLRLVPGMLMKILKNHLLDVMIVFTVR